MFQSGHSAAPHATALDSTGCQTFRPPGTRPPRPFRLGSIPQDLPPRSTPPKIGRGHRVGRRWRPYISRRIVSGRAIREVSPLAPVARLYLSFAVELLPLPF